MLTTLLAMTRRAEAEGGFLGDLLGVTALMVMLVGALYLPVL